MAFVKQTKGTPYYKRFQTKFRRRRQAKTDYFARKRLTFQDKDKYNSPKYRFIVRFTNKKAICQVAYATIRGDRILCAAESDELRRFGLTAGLNNYASTYCTGLLLARRLLNKLGMDKIYPGNTKIDGAAYDVSENPNEERRPFMAYLDVGLARTTIGRKVFAALKGACDGGLYIPHKNTRFPGFSKQDEHAEYDPKVHRDRIFGVHVDQYMKHLKDEGEQEYKDQFCKWDECLQKNGVKSVEELYKKIQASIKKDFQRQKKAVKQNPKRDHAKKRQVRLTNKKRKDNVQKRIQIALKQAAKKKK